MKMTVIILIALTLPFTACGKRKNPLESVDPITLQQWLMKLETAQMIHCSLLWQAPENSNADALASCAPELQRIATAMNKGGVSATEIIPADLQLKAMWMTYTTGLEERAERQKKAEKSRKEIQEILGAVPLPSKRETQ